VGTIVACNRRAVQETAQAKTDLEQVCKTQRSFLQTKKLMKKAREADLATERDLHFQAEVKSSLVKEALAEARRAPAGRRRKALDLAAEKAGLAGWSCPELDRL
jgi:hypothetical protein